MGIFGLLFGSRPNSDKKGGGNIPDRFADTGNELLNRPNSPSSTSRLAGSPRQSSSGGITPQNSRLNTDSGAAAKQNTKPNRKDSQPTHLFSGDSSVEAKKAAQYIGERIKADPPTMRRLGIGTADGLKKFVISATGRDYFRPEQAKKDREFLRQGKIEKTRLYEKASSSQQHAMRNTDTQKHLKGIYEGMFKK